MDGPTRNCCFVSGSMNAEVENAAKENAANETNFFRKRQVANLNWYTGWKIATTYVVM